MPRFSIVIPVYRSEESLPVLLQRINAALTGSEHEVILVDDCSPDRSWEVIKDLNRRHHGVMGLSLRMNVGQDSALMAGLRASTGDFVVLMDDDLQHAPEDIPRLIASIGDGDICYASYAQKEQAAWKNLGSWLNGKMAEWFLGKPRGLYLSPFKIMCRGLVDEVCRYEGAYPYVDGLILRATSRIKQIEVRHHERFFGRGNYGLVKSLRVAVRHMTGFSVHPLRLAAIVGAWISAFGFGLLFYYIVSFFWHQDTPAGWTTLVTLVLCLNGATLLSLGLVGEYVGRSYLTINQKPQYSVWQATVPVTSPSREYASCNGGSIKAGIDSSPL